jgi:hypothetical protein
VGARIGCVEGQLRGTEAVRNPLISSKKSIVSPGVSVDHIDGPGIEVKEPELIRLTSPGARYQAMPRTRFCHRGEKMVPEANRTCAGRSGERVGGVYSGKDFEPVSHTSQTGLGPLKHGNWKMAARDSRFKTRGRRVGI